MTKAEMEDEIRELRKRIRQLEAEVERRGRLPTVYYPPREPRTIPAPEANGWERC